MWELHDGMGWWMAWGTVTWLLFVVVLAALIAWLARASAATGGDAGTAGTKDRALDLLRERYARGELDRETFERMRRDLER